MRAFPFSLFLFFLTTSMSAQAGSLEELTAWMTGAFTSKTQALRDSDYYAISLMVTPIWQDRYPGQHWLYVEQALIADLDKPYRQRIYQVEAMTDGTFRSTVYLLPDNQGAIGKSTDTAFFDRWEPEDLDIRDGCAVVLAYTDGIYTGSTKGQDCKSSLRGASYASSVVTISRDRIVSWDQGFDADNVQVWGAEKEGYLFDRH